MDEQFINNHPDLKTFRQELRNDLTPAEAKMWIYLQRKQLDGRRFRRQHSIGPFILDSAERLAIELDGQPHMNAEAAEYDREQDLFLAHYGILVLRFVNRYVFENPEGVLNHIRENFGWYKKSGVPPAADFIPPRPPAASTPPWQGES